ncbi:hypothetical protein ATERTT37_007130 [Aspergillus terreus]
MGGLSTTRGRNDTHLAQTIAEAGFREPKYEVRVSSPGTTRENPDGFSIETQKEPSFQNRFNEVTQGAPVGVQKAEAAALAWSKKTAYMTYVLVWLSFFLLAFQSSISTNVIHNAYASFEVAPAVSTASIVASVVSGVVKLPAAKLLNIWGRTEGFLVFVGVYLVGLILLAACNGPNAYAVGYVFYWVGYDAIFLILDVFMADTSGLRNRAFAFGFASTPFICTAFTGPLAAQSFIEHASWRWAYGAFAVVTPFIFLPLAGVFKFYQRKAERMYIFAREPSGRNMMQSVVYYINEFDVLGALLLTAAFLLLLLPFSLQSYGKAEYNSAAFITMIIIGYYAWELYFYNFCMVVYQLSIGMTGYVGQIYNVGSCFWSAIFGLIVYATRQFKYTCLGFGLPLVLLGAGLMIHFRTADGSIGYIVMCQIFIAFGGGTLVIGQDMAVMAASDRGGIPMMLSMIGLSSSLGGAIGYAVSAAIYSNTFPSALRQALPAESKSDYLKIYRGGYTAQLEYPAGSAVRLAINEAYGEYMKYACITATCVMALGIPAIAVWRNFRVDKKQNKGEMM